MIMYLTAIWLTPSGSSTAHIYTHTHKHTINRKLIYCRFVKAAINFRVIYLARNFLTSRKKITEDLTHSLL
jgi:hypothetical protein